MHMYDVKSTQTIQLIIILLIHHAQQQGVVSRNDFEVVKVHRYRETPIRNSFYLKSKDNETLCTSRICEQRSGYLTGGGKTRVCQCQCKSVSVYSSTSDDCVYGTDEGTGSFVVATIANRTQTTWKQIPFYSVSQLKNNGVDDKGFSVGTANIRYCKSRTCGNETVPVDCGLDWVNSFYDENGWKRLWENEWDVDFTVVHRNQLKMIESNVRDYSGLLMKIGLRCNASQDIANNPQTSFAMFAVSGEFKAPLPKIPATTTTTTTTTKTTTTTTTPSKTNATTLATLTTLNTTISTTPSTTTGNTTTQPSTEITTTQQTPSDPSTTLSTQTATNGTVSATNTTQSSTTLLPKNSAQHSHESGDMNKKVLIIVTTVLGTFLLISCILVMCFYYRWKKAKRQRKPDHSLSVPSFFFQPETPVFLIGAENSQDPNNKKKSKDKKLQRQDRNRRQGEGPTMQGARQVSSSEPNLYSEQGAPLGGVGGEQGAPLGGVGGREPTRKVGSIRQLYASIDKFLKPSKHRKSNETLDEGYTTDENYYDYRKFAAFPKDLYEEPGSIISASLEEPEYRIPEDFITSQMSVSRNDFESDYLSPHDTIIPPIKPPRVFSNAQHASLHNIDSSSTTTTTENHYDQVGRSLNNQIQKMCNAYDEVGQVLQDKIARQDVDTDEDEENDYAEPHDAIRRGTNSSDKNNKVHTSSISGIVQNRHAIELMKSSGGSTKKN